MNQNYLDPSLGRPSRRSLLLAGLGTAMSLPFLSACAGFDTSGAAAGEGTVGFLSTQFTPVEEKQRYEAVLKKFLKVPVAYNPVDAGVFASTVRSQVDSGNVSLSLLGGLHGDLAPLADSLEDVDPLIRDLAGRGFGQDILELTKVGGSTSKYVPWMQATYVVAVNKKALEWLPSGVDVNDLSYEDFLAWAKAAKQGAGRPVFGMPAGPKGLHHRFYQGFLLPSFTGGQITTFRNPDAVTAWNYMRELWDNMAPASTNYDAMQEPLARGEVLVAWDHVARLVGAPADKPDDWLMVPAPRGPQGPRLHADRRRRRTAQGRPRARAGRTGHPRTRRTRHPGRDPAQQRVLPRGADGTARRPQGRRRPRSGSRPAAAAIAGGPPGPAAGRAGHEGRGSLPDLQELLPGDLPQRLPRPVHPGPPGKPAQHHPE